MSGRRSEWRRRPELNRGKRFCRPLRNHSATTPRERLKTDQVCVLLVLGQRPAALSGRCKPMNRNTKHGAGKGARTLALNLGKVALYQLSYSRLRSAGNRRYSRAGSRSVKADNALIRTFFPRYVPMVFPRFAPMVHRQLPASLPIPMHRRRDALQPAPAFIRSGQAARR